MVSKDIMSPYAPKFPFYDYKNYLPERIKSYLFKNEKLKEKNFTYSSFYDSMDDLNTPKTPYKQTFLEEEEKPSQDMLFLQDIDMKLKSLNINMKKKLEKCKSFEEKSLSMFSHSKPPFLKQKESILITSPDLKDSQNNLNFIQNYTHFKKKNNPMIFTKQGKYIHLKSSKEGEFQDLLDLLKISRKDRKLINENFLLFRVRRKSATDEICSGGICKKLEKTNFSQTNRETKINIINFFSLKGKKEYASPIRKQKSIVNSPEITSRIKKAIIKSKVKISNNNNVNETVVVSNQEITENNQKKIQLLKERSNSIEVMLKDKTDFVNLISKFGLKQNSDRKFILPIIEKQRSSVKNQSKLNNIKNKSALLQPILFAKNDNTTTISNDNDSKNYKSQNTKNKVNENRKTIEEALKIIINNGQTNGRIRKLFKVPKNNMSNGELDKITSKKYEAKLKNETPYMAMNDEIEGYKIFLERKLGKLKGSKKKLMSFDSNFSKKKNF